MWLFRTCLEEGPVNRLPIGKIQCKALKMHWIKTDEESHQIALITEGVLSVHQLSRDFQRIDVHKSIDLKVDQQDGKLISDSF